MCIHARRLLISLAALATGTVASAGATWSPTSLTGAPTARFNHTAVWTGSKMIVWGGNDDGNVNSGAIYDPATDTWTATSTAGAPAARQRHTAVWTGTKMLVWGGIDSEGLNTGGIYDPASDTWTATSTVGAPTLGSSHAAVWTGSKLIVWGRDLLWRQFGYRCDLRPSI